MCRNDAFQLRFNRANTVFRAEPVSTVNDRYMSGIIYFMILKRKISDKGQLTLKIILIDHFIW